MRYLATVLVGLPLLALNGGCGDSKVEKPLVWEIAEDSCVLSRSAVPRVRVINYADPELCDRFVQERGPNYLRVAPPEMAQKITRNQP